MVKRVSESVPGINADATKKAFGVDEVLKPGDAKILQF